MKARHQQHHASESELRDAQGYDHEQRAYCQRPVQKTVVPPGQGFTAFDLRKHIHLQGARGGARRLFLQYLPDETLESFRAAVGRAGVDGRSHADQVSRLSPGTRPSPARIFASASRARMMSVLIFGSDTCSRRAMSW